MAAYDDNCPDSGVDIRQAVTSGRCCLKTLEFVRRAAFERTESYDVLVKAESIWIAGSGAIRLHWMRA